MIEKRPSPNSGKVIVYFEIPGTIWADRINLVGDFNDWNEESLPLSRNRRGDWHTELELDAGREYRFRYLFNGHEWRDEFLADKFTPNAFGSFDSVVAL
jgi:1,4-alpha-glucan branching enzyme